MADADLMWEKNIAGWLADKLAEQSGWREGDVEKKIKESVQYDGFLFCLFWFLSLNLVGSPVRVVLQVCVTCEVPLPPVQNARLVRGA